jgi:hypothetical protein
MSNVRDFRRANLQRIIEQRGGTNVVAKILGYTNGSFLTQMTGPNPERHVSEVSARKYESTLGLPLMSLDAPTDVIDAQHIIKREKAPQGMTNAQLADLIRHIGARCEVEHVELPTSKFANLVALAITQPESVDDIIALLK